MMLIVWWYWYWCFCYRRSQVKSYTGKIKILSTALSKAYLHSQEDDATRGVERWESIFFPSPLSEKTTLAVVVSEQCTSQNSLYPGPRGFLALASARSHLRRPRERENLWDQGTKRVNHVTNVPNCSCALWVRWWDFSNTKLFTLRQL